jgi:ribosomal protein S18 acetylase RimI-like enzyme
MITIRKAKIDDAEFIARGLLTALWVPEEEREQKLPIRKRLVEMDDSLYSWRNAHIAQYDGTDAAVLISYDGASYAAASALTFRYVRDHGEEDYTGMTHEAEAGEWYLDTLAVMPAFRRKGLATALLHRGIELCRQNPATQKCTLYVDPAHPWVVELYSSIGFRPEGEAFIFGQTFKKMSIVTG